VPGSIPNSAAMLFGWTRLTRTMVWKKVRALNQGAMLTQPRR